MRRFLQKLVLVLLSFPALSEASILVYRGSFIETEVTSNGNVTKTKNIFVAIQDGQPVPDGASVVWFKDKGTKQTEFLSFYQPKVLVAGPSLSSTTTIYFEQRVTDASTYFYATRGLSGRNSSVVLNKSPQLLGTVAKVLAGTETIISNYPQNYYATRRFRLQLDIKATQEANADPMSPGDVRNAYLEKLKEHGYPQPPSPI